MTETKTCEQCQVDKDIEGFYRRPQKNDPAKRMKICIDCHKQNLAENRRRWEEQQRQLQEEQRQRQAAERTAREQWQQWQDARELHLSIQANKRCPRCKQIQTNGHFWVGSNDEEHFSFPRYCQACVDGTPHLIYRLICPLSKQTRYIGITSQPLEYRLAGHMRNESGTERKRAWIDTLRSHNLSALIEVIDTASSTREAKKAEQDWIDHYIRLGCPLTNNEVNDAQRVLDLQSGRIKTQIPSREEMPDLYDYAVAQFRLNRVFELNVNKKLLIARWYNRKQCAYFLDSTYDPPFSRYYYGMEAEKYRQVIFEHHLPEKKRDRKALLCNVTIVYLYWDENQLIRQEKWMHEDIRYFLEKHVPLICTKMEKDGTTVTGFVIGLTQKNALDVHPFSYNVDPTRALVIAPFDPGSDNREANESHRSK